MISENEFARLHAECAQLQEDNDCLLECLARQRFLCVEMTIDRNECRDERNRYWRAAFGMMWLAIGYAHAMDRLSLRADIDQIAVACVAICAQRVVLS